MDPILFQRLKALAESAVNEETDAVPEALRSIIAKCPVFYTTTEDWNPPRQGAADYDKDMLGLFTGAGLLDSPATGAGDGPQVTLFLDLLWWWSDGEETKFKVEAAIACLKELSCYLGWDRDTSAALPYLGNSSPPRLYGPLFSWSSLPQRRFQLITDQHE